MAICSTWPAFVSLSKFKSSSSVVFLGLIAICKCLSPSHGALSYSLYQEYKNWRNENNLESSNFKGFRSNRFGRISGMATLYLKHKNDLVNYFDSTVNENSNMLVLASHLYFYNDRFDLGCKVYSFFGTMLIEPLMSILGIDH